MARSDEYELRVAYLRNNETLTELRRLICENTERSMNSKRTFLLSWFAAMMLMAPLAVAGTHGGGGGQFAPAPMAPSHPAPTGPMGQAPSVTHNGPTSTRSTANMGGATFHHHRHHGPGVVFFDDFGYPYWYDWYGYPYGYYGYYDNQSYYGDVVVQTQAQLARAGYYHGAIDGVTGPQTRAAIRSYERANGLRVDGAISQQLLETMGRR
jgi:Putative peptidoglycan binding domain